MAEHDVKIIQDAGSGVPRQRVIPTLNAITDAASFRSAFGIGTGTGDVVSVNDVTPDVDGNVELTPEDIGAFSAANAGTIATLDAPEILDLAAVTEPLRGPEPFQYNYYKALSGNLTLTDSASPSDGDGYRLTLIGDSTARLITIPSSISEAQGGGITQFYVPENGSVTIKRQYVNGAWRIWGDPAPLAAGFSARIKLLQGLGATTIAQTINIESATATSNLSDGTLYLGAIYIPTVSTCTGLRWFQTVEGNFTADNNNRVGLYRYAVSTGIATLVASSANSGSTWDTNVSNQYVVRAFTSTYVAQPGVYYAAALYNQSAQVTAPAVAAGAAFAQSTMVTPGGVSLSGKLFATLSSQTDLPSTIDIADAGTSVSTTPRFWEVY